MGPLSMNIDTMRKQPSPLDRRPSNDAWIDATNVDQTGRLFPRQRGLTPSLTPFIQHSC